MCVFIIKELYWLFVDMGQFDPTKGKQALEIRSSLSERRSLTDPIRPGLLPSSRGTQPALV